jgi:uncharacterized membrane protein
MILGSSPRCCRLGLLLLFLVLLGWFLVGLGRGLGMGPLRPSLPAGGEIRSQFRLRGGEIVHLHGGAAESIVRAEEAARAARSLGGGPAAGMAAVAAAVCLGLARDAIRAGLAAAR